MIRNIIFDMGGVLIHYVPREILSHLKLSGEDEVLLVREMFNSVEWVRLDRGTISHEDAVAAMQARLPQHLHAAVEQVVGGWWELELRPMEGMEPVLAELKRLGYGLYLLSNATARQPEYFDRIPGSQYFDGRIISAHYKLLKPQKEIFDTLLREYGLQAEECFFVDDLNINIEGAFCAGIAGAVFDGDVPRLRRALRAAGAAVELGEN